MFDSGIPNHHQALASYNLGADTLTMRWPLQAFVSQSDIANDTGVTDPGDISQRPLDKRHASGLAVYILKGVLAAARKLAQRDHQETAVFDAIFTQLGTQKYYSLQPIVVNIPAPLADLSPFVERNKVEQELTYRISLPPHVIMWVIDGQHRRFAMQLVLEFLQYVTSHRLYPKKGSLFPLNGRPVSVPPQELAAWRLARNVAFQKCTVAVEAHLNLSPEEQRQVFHDLNNLGKGVAASLAFDFDVSNPLNNYVKSKLIDGGLLKAKVDERDITDWRSHDGRLPRKDVVAVCSILMINKTNPKTARPVQVSKMEAMADRFWQTVNKIEGFGAKGAKLKTVSAQPVVLKALAKLAYDFAAGRQADPKYLDSLLKGIASFDFSHGNKVWDYYNTPATDRDRLFPGLVDYLPREDGNRDIGSRDEDGRMRFGAKHNDIYPILGDMIRWQLKLPTRHAEI